MYELEKQQIIDACRQLVSEGLIRGTSGNISIRCAENTVAVSPSGISYGTLKLSDIPLVDLHGSVIEGEKKPSSETPMHTAIYRARQDVNSIVHCHALYSTVFSALGYDRIPVLVVPVIHYDPVLVAPFEIPGSIELAESTVKYLGEKGTAVILQNHGLLAANRDLKAAMTCCSYVEEAAQAACIALQIINKPTTISQDVVDGLLHRVKQGKAI